jgi:hypothetical protein
MKTSIKYAVMMVVSFVLLIACEAQKPQSKLYNEVITQDNLLEIADRAKEDVDFSREELELLSSGITRLTVSDTIVGKTVGYVIEKQKAFAREATAERMQANMTRVEIVLNHSFKFLELVPRDSLDYIVYEITNKSNQDIANIEGMLQFYNFQNQLIKQYALLSKHISNNEVIKAGETKRLAYPFRHDDDNQRDNIMRQLRGVGDLKPLWQPTTIEFVGGKTLSVAEPQQQQQQQQSK